jgi:hypothetical protein
MRYFIAAIILIFGSGAVAACPLVYNVTIVGNSSICTGASARIDLSDSENDLQIRYQLYRNNVPVGGEIRGTGNPLTWFVTEAGTYTVRGIDRSGVSTCTRPMNGSVVVVVNQRPSYFPMTGGGISCNGSGVPVGINGSEAGIEYTLYRDGVSTGSVITGTGGAISWANQTMAGNYTALARNPNGGCTLGIADGVTVTNQTFNIFPVSGISATCVDSPRASVILGGSQSGVNYRLTSNGVYIAETAGTGGELRWDNLTTSGVYEVTAIHLPSGCMQTMGSISITVTALPLAAVVSGGGNYCSGAFTVPIQLSSQEAGVSYQLKVNGVNTGSPKNGVSGGGVLTWTVPVGDPNVYTYTVVATNTSTGCSRPMTGSAIVNAYPAPNTYSVIGGGKICPGSTRNIGLTGATSNTTYRFFRDGSLVAEKIGSQALSVPVSTPGTYTVVAIDQQGCMSNMQGSAVVILATPLTKHSVSGGGPTCAGEQGASISLGGSDSGVSYQLRRDGVPVGQILGGSGTALNWPHQGAGSYTVLATHNSEGCTEPMEGSVSVTVNPLPAQCSVAGGGIYCSEGAPQTIRILCSETGVNYQLQRNGVNAGDLPGRRCTSSATRATSPIRKSNSPPACTTSATAPTCSAPTSAPAGPT